MFFYLDQRPNHGSQRYGHHEVRPYFDDEDADFIGLRGININNSSNNRSIPKDGMEDGDLIKIEEV